MSLCILFATHASADIRTAVYRSVAQQARHLQSQGHEVELLTRNDLAGPAWARIDPIVLPLLLAVRDLSRFDVVVFHSYLGWAFHLFRFVLDRHRRVKTLTWFHGLEPLYHRAVSEEYRRANQTISRRFRLLHHTLLPHLLKQSCRQSDAVLCFNSIEADYLENSEWARADRIHRVANGVEADCFLSRRHRAVARRLLFVGQWLPAKGTRYLVDAFTALAALGDFELACVGTGSTAETIQREFPAVVRSRVSVLPRVDREQLYEQLRLADVFVFPTLSEGFSCALLEAMAAELPVVTTPVGAAVDFLASGRNGVVVPCADVTALVAAVARMAGDVETRTMLGSSARQTAMRFTLRASGVDFAGRIHDVVNHDATDRPVEHPDAA